jgi:hypothetical protein
MSEMWFHIARHSGLVGAWRLTSVCRAARAGAKDWLRKLPGLLLCGGRSANHGAWGARTSEVWRLDLEALRWERLPDLTTGSCVHTCCAVRGGVVVLGGLVGAGEENSLFRGLVTAPPTTSVEIFGRDTSGAVQKSFKILPPLSWGPISSFAAIMMDEGESDQGQVLLFGGQIEGGPSASTAVCKVDLATGVCTAQPSLLCPKGRCIADCTAGRLQDGRIVCAGTTCFLDVDDWEEIYIIPQSRCWSRPRTARPVKPTGLGGCCLGRVSFTTAVVGAC